MIPDKAHVLSALRSYKDDIREQFHVKGMGLFGSVVRGEATEESDIDIVVDFDDGASLFDLCGLGNYLEDRFGRKVDVVSRRSIKPELKESILADVVAI